MQQQQVVLNFDYLRPEQSLVDAIVHDAQYIKKKERSKSQRRIWENVPYDAYEKEKMADFMKIVAKNKIVLPQNWTDSDTLKMVYCGKFKDKNYLKVLQSNLAWRAIPNNFQPTDINIAFLQKGIVYTYGRDKQQRPVIIMNLELVNLKQFSEEVYINALSYYFEKIQLEQLFDNIIKKHCFVPGKVENWVFIMDTKKLGLSKFPFKAIQIATKTMQVNFCGCLDKLYLLNPSSSLSFSWKMVSAVADADTMEKVQMLKPNEYNKIQERIPANQLEEQFGGIIQMILNQLIIKIQIKIFFKIKVSLRNLKIINKLYQKSLNKQSLININLNTIHPQIFKNSGYFSNAYRRPPINIAIPGGYTEEILKAVESMKTAEIVIQKEV